MESCRLFPEIPTEDEIRRLRRLNTVRNAIAHDGTVRIEEALGAETSFAVAAAVILLSQEIAESHIARDLLGIKTRSKKASISTIEAFFSEGSFRWRRVKTDHQRGVCRFKFDQDV